MINELYGLSSAMKSAGIFPRIWHRKYKPIPNIRPNAPCIRILVSKGKVVLISEVKPELGAVLRKYGSNQGSYPCLNLAPLFRITDGKIKKQLEKLNPEELNPEKLKEIEELCSENNWGDKFCGKYNISMKKTTDELSGLALNFQPLNTLIDETRFFENPEHLHEALKTAVFEMLQKKENVSLALTVLFHFEKADANTNSSDDYGSLSVAFDSSSLLETGISAISTAFVEGFNGALLEKDSQEASTTASIRDAFGIPFEPIEEPMPQVKLAGGFDAILRTMFKEHRCQTRYGRIENASYPVSPEMRKNLQAALTWVSSADRKDITWINTDRNEILFAYPSRLPEVPVSFTQMFKRPTNREKTFEEQAHQFLKAFQHPKDPKTDSRADNIQVFI